ncbi:MAG TPA: hypothetical protein ENK02_03495 [Planctomycetes bacterium]|nr:hypothetical protein [Planctomycetota bacterium]
MYSQIGGISQGGPKFSRGIEIQIGTGATKGGLAIYGYATATQPFNPDKDLPQFFYTVVPILGVF